jgi:hypothetical protein
MANLRAACLRAKHTEEVNKDRRWYVYMYVCLNTEGESTGYALSAPPNADRNFLWAKVGVGVGVCVCVCVVCKRHASTQRPSSADSS